MSDKMTVSIVGASGYVGGELLRLLLGHPNVEIKQITSEQHQTKFAYSVHPNLRGFTKLKFVSIQYFQPCDFLFVSLPHGEAQRIIEKLAKLAPRIIDLSADFRLSTSEVYQKWYGSPHPKPEFLSKFVYGIPEVNREKLRNANYATGAGCNATAVVLGLLPFLKSNIEIEQTIADIKVGSSEAGNKPDLSSHHPERSGCVRSYALIGHRHTAEVLQVMNWPADGRLQLSLTAIEMVRGILATIHITPKTRLDEKELWKIFRRAYQNEPFIRIVKDCHGIYRLPEPKILTGSNLCDVGFVADESSRRVVVISAIDNLMKGAAGNAVQTMNVMMGWEETLGLDFIGLHPI